MGRRTQAAQGGLDVQLATSDGVQKNRVAAKEAQTPGLPVRVAFPQGLLGPRPRDSALAEPPEGDTEGQLQPQDSVCLRQYQILDMTVVADADPTLRAGFQRRPHIGAELLQRLHLPVGEPVDSVQLYNRQAESLSQSMAQGCLAGACGTPNRDAQADGESVGHMALAPGDVASSTSWLVLGTYAILVT